MQVLEYAIVQGVCEKVDGCLQGPARMGRAPVHAEQIESRREDVRAVAGARHLWHMATS